MGHRLCRCPFLYVNTGFSALVIKNQSHICRFYSVIVTGYAYGFSRASLIAFFKTAAFNPKHYIRLYSKKNRSFSLRKAPVFLLFKYYAQGSSAFGIRTPVSRYCSQRNHLPSLPLCLSFIGRGESAPPHGINSFI